MPFRGAASLDFESNRVGSKIGEIEFAQMKIEITMFQFTNTL